MNLVREIKIGDQDLIPVTPKIKQPKKTKIVIVGGGLNGLVLAILLAKKSFDVIVFEKRKSLEEFHPSLGRAMNLTLCERGLKTFDQIQLRHKVLEKAVCLIGRDLHKENEIEFQPYGKVKKETLYGIRRYDLSAILYNEATQYPNISIQLGQTCLSMNKEKKTARLEDFETKSIKEESYDLLIGADGNFSEVRKLMHSGIQSQSSEKVSSWGYKELSIHQNNKFPLNRLHVWPRREALIVGIPNLDGTLTCSLFYIRDQNSGGISELQFKKLFPDLIQSVHELITQFNFNPTNSLHTIETSPWVFKDSVALVGDACHGALPFLGQGLNAGLEDCLALANALDKPKRDWKTSLHKYNLERKNNADALTLLIERHLNFLKTGHQSIKEKLSEKFIYLFSIVIPGLGQPIYSLISHTTVSYEKILKCAKLRERYAIAIPTILFLAGAIAFFSISKIGGY